MARATESNANFISAIEKGSESGTTTTLTGGGFGDGYYAARAATINYVLGHGRASRSQASGSLGAQWVDWIRDRVKDVGEAIGGLLGFHMSPVVEATSRVGSSVNAALLAALNADVARGIFSQIIVANHDWCVDLSKCARDDYNDILAPALAANDVPAIADYFDQHDWRVETSMWVLSLRSR